MNDKLELLQRDGNTHFVNGNFTAAIECYTSALSAGGQKTESVNLELEIQLLANRSAAYNSLELWKPALTDAESVLNQFPSHPKAIYRKAKSLFGLGRYKDAIEFLEVRISEPPTDSSVRKEILKLLSKAKIFANQQEYGDYNMSQFIKDKNYRLDLAEYTGPVEISQYIIPGKGRGLIATENILPGQLLIACKAFAIVFGSGKSNLIESIQNVLSIDPGKANELYKLYAGPELGYIKDESAEVIDLKRIEGICTYNGFAHGDRLEIHDDEDRASYDNWGVWLISSYINHSCVDCNCTWRICGDFMFVRAFKSIPKGEEILISYLSPEESYERRMCVLRKHQFICKCRLCQAEDSEAIFIRQQREKYFARLETLVKSSYSALDVKKLCEVLEGLKKLRRRKHSDLNFYLWVGLKKLAEWQYGHFQYAECARSLETVHGMLENTLLWKAAVHVAVNVISSYLKCGNIRKAEEWILVLRNDVRIAYGTPVSDIIYEVAPHTVEEIRAHGLQF